MREKIKTDINSIFVDYINNNFPSLEESFKNFLNFTFDKYSDEEKEYALQYIGDFHAQLFDFVDVEDEPSKRVIEVLPREKSVFFKGIEREDRAVQNLLKKLYKARFSGRAQQWYMSRKRFDAGLEQLANELDALGFDLLVPDDYASVIDPTQLEQPPEVVSEETIEVVQPLKREDLLTKKDRMEKLGRNALIIPTNAETADYLRDKLKEHFGDSRFGIRQHQTGSTKGTYGITSRSFPIQLSDHVEALRLIRSLGFQDYLTTMMEDSGTIESTIKRLEQQLEKRPDSTSLSISTSIFPLEYRGEPIYVPVVIEEEEEIQPRTPRRTPQVEALEGMSPLGRSQPVAQEFSYIAIPVREGLLDSTQAETLGVIKSGRIYNPLTREEILEAGLDRLGDDGERVNEGFPFKPSQLFFYKIPKTTEDEFIDQESVGLNELLAVGSTTASGQEEIIDYAISVFNKLVPATQKKLKDGYFRLLKNDKERALNQLEQRMKSSFKSLYVYFPFPLKLILKSMAERVFVEPSEPIPEREKPVQVEESSLDYDYLDEADKKIKNVAPLVQEFVNVIYAYNKTSEKELLQTFKQLKAAKYGGIKMYSASPSQWLVPNGIGLSIPIIFEGDTKANANVTLTAEKHVLKGTRKTTVFVPAITMRYGNESVIIWDAFEDFYKKEGRKLKATITTADKQKTYQKFLKKYGLSYFESVLNTFIFQHLIMGEEINGMSGTSVGQLGSGLRTFSRDYLELGSAKMDFETILKKLESQEYIDTVGDPIYTAKNIIPSELKARSNPSDGLLVYEDCDDRFELDDGSFLQIGPLTPNEQKVFDDTIEAMTNRLPSVCQKQSKERAAMYQELRTQDPLLGLCYLGAQTVWVLLGALNQGRPQYAPYVIPKSVLGDDTHWFVVRLSDGTIIDPTASQFGNKCIPYHKARQGSFGLHLRTKDGSKQLYEQGIFTPDKKTRALLEVIRSNPNHRFIKSAFEGFEKKGTEGSFTRYVAQNFTGKNTPSKRKKAAQQIKKEYEKWERGGRFGSAPYSSRTYKRAIFYLNILEK